MLQRYHDPGQIEGEGMTTEARKRAREKYNKANYKAYTFRFHKTHEADVIEHLEAQPNKLGYIRGLIRNDMECGK